jgi:ComF family protein
MKFQKITSWVNALKELFFAIISPPFCEYCRIFLAQRTILCVNCNAKISPVAVHDLKISSVYQVPVYAIGAYQEPLKSLVLAKNRSYRLMSSYLAQKIYEQTPFLNLPCDYLVPVPLHWSRIWRRGYNQSQVMCQRLQELRPNLQVADLLKRHRATKYQTNLSKSDRAKNLQDAFRLNPNIKPEIYFDKHLILIDDVFTSGATLINCIKILRALKPKSISVIVACRAI